MSLAKLRRSSTSSGKACSVTVSVTGTSVQVYEYVVLSEAERGQLVRPSSFQVERMFSPGCSTCVTATGVAIPVHRKLEVTPVFESEPRCVR